MLTVSAMLERDIGPWTGQSGLTPFERVSRGPDRGRGALRYTHSA